MRACAVRTRDQRTLARGRAGTAAPTPSRVTRRSTGTRPRRDFAVLGRASLCIAVALVARAFRLALCAAVLFLDPGVDLFTVNLHLGRRFDAELHLPRADFENGDLDRVTDADVFA